MNVDRLRSAMNTDSLVPRGSPSERSGGRSASPRSTRYFAVDCAQILGTEAGQRIDMMPSQPTGDRDVIGDYQHRATRSLRSSGAGYRVLDRKAVRRLHAEQFGPRHMVETYSHCMNRSTYQAKKGTYGGLGSQGVTSMRSTRELRQRAEERWAYTTCVALRQRRSHERV